MIELTENRGFAGGVAEGIRAAAGEWVLCVNNDATVEEGAIAELLRVADDADDDVGSIAALMVFADRPDVINSAGIEVDRLGVAWDRLLGQPVDMGKTSVTEVFGASAGAALYRRAMLDEVPFEESFFAYLEDVDVAWRARMRGWRSLYAPSAVVAHEFSATARHGSPLKYYWSGRNRVRVLARNATTRQLVRNLRPDPRLRRHLHRLRARERSFGGAHYGANRRAAIVAQGPSGQFARAASCGACTVSGLSGNRPPPSPQPADVVTRSNATIALLVINA